MADYFSTLPNFVNESYASPEQLATQRAYAEALTKRSGENVNRPTGAIANMISALTAGLERNRANEIQSQAAGRNAQDQAALISQLGSSQKADPGNLGAILANPMASPETRALAVHLLTMKPVQDVAGRPAMESPATGTVAQPITGQYQPGYRSQDTAGGVSGTVPVAAPAFPGTPAARAPVPSTPKVWGDNEAVSQGLYPAPQAANGSGGQAPGPSVLPAAPAPATFGSRFDALAAKDRELTAAKTFSQGGAESNTNVAKEDIAAAAGAPTIKRIAGVMLDDLRRSGDNMTWGPTAQWSNDVKRFAANYAPGLMKKQLEDLASADSFDKMSAQLTSLLAKGGGTDAQLFNNMKSVPGSHNSKEGAEALLQMTLQVADQSQALRQFTAGAKDAAQYEQARNEFFRRNPIINPITKNPIQLDLQRQESNTGSGGFKVLKVH